MRHTALWTMLVLAMVMVAMVTPAPARAQEAPLPPPCTDSEYVALQAIPWEFQTDEERTRYMELFRKCTEARVTYYRFQAAFRPLPATMLAGPRSGKEPAEALLWSLLVPGGGQFYNGDLGRGTLFLLGAAAGWTAVYLGGEPDHGDVMRLWGAGIVVGVHWGSMLEAVRSAR